MQGEKKKKGQDSFPHHSRETSAPWVLVVTGLPCNCQEVVVCYWVKSLLSVEML